MSFNTSCDHLQGLLYHLNLHVHYVYVGQIYESDCVYMYMYILYVYMKIRCLRVMMCRPVQARCLRAVIRLMPSRHTSCSCISWAAARTRKSQRSGFLAGLEVSHQATTCTFSAWCCSGIFGCYVIQHYVNRLKFIHLILCLCTCTYLVSEWVCPLK